MPRLAAPVLVLVLEQSHICPTCALHSHQLVQLAAMQAMVLHRKRKHGCTSVCQPSPAHLAALLCLTEVVPPSPPPSDAQNIKRVVLTDSPHESHTRITNGLRRNSDFLFAFSFLGVVGMIVQVRHPRRQPPFQHAQVSHCRSVQHRTRSPGCGMHPLGMGPCAQTRQTRHVTLE